MAVNAAGCQHLVGVRANCQCIHAIHVLPAPVSAALLTNLQHADALLPRHKLQTPQARSSHCLGVLNP